MSADGDDLVRLAAARLAEELERQTDELRQLYPEPKPTAGGAAAPEPTAGYFRRA